MIQLKVCIFQLCVVTWVLVEEQRLTLAVPKTMLNCIDNSGAALVECAMVVGQKRHASIGEHCF